MHILPPFKADFSEPLWLPAPENPPLPIHEIHLWRAHLESPRCALKPDPCPVSRSRTEAMKTALFRNDVMENYTTAPGLIAGPASGLRFAVAQCDHIALVAVSRNVREVGLDLERVRHDIPFEEMAGGFLDARSQWDLRITWSQQEKAWKFFQIWTSNEACAQAHPSSAHSCRVHAFSPHTGFIAALALNGGPDFELSYWDWQT